MNLREALHELSKKDCAHDGGCYAYAMLCYVYIMPI
jgi:hypothetical protein